MADVRSDNSGDVYHLSCLEIRGGNGIALYCAQLPGLDAWVSCRPLDGARGGDLYYLSVCRQGSISRVTIADVAGHGEPVSTVAQGLRDALFQHVNEWDQSALIRQLNDGFLKGESGGQYATAFLLSHYAQTGELVFTNAGHVPPLWYRARLREWSFLWDATLYSKDIIDLPLGMIPGTAYRQTGVELEPDDLLLLYTDGVSESHDVTGEQLGLERLLDIAGKLPTGSAEEAGAALLQAVARFRGSAPLVDDETIVALHRRLSPATPRVEI